MAAAQTVAAAARSRYAESFTSRIFEPAEPPQARAFVPAGKRRDQTTSEMFGTYNDKDLRAQPTTFVPKDDAMSARQKKLNFLSSDVLPHTRYGAGAPAGSPYTAPSQPYGGMEADDDDQLRPQVRRQMELSSELFGRETPGVNPEDFMQRDPKSRLTPSDFKWFSVPEPVQGGSSAEVTHHDRSYHEKCSNLFDHTSPQAGPLDDAQKRSKEEEELGDKKRRSNVYYSDLFGRNTPMDAPRGVEERRPKLQGPLEDQIVVHQDWTDSRTELMCGARSPREDAPGVRKAEELHQARIFGMKEHYDPPKSVAPVTTDNSDKVRFTPGLSTQEIHQAHLRTSLTPTEFYDEARGTKHWEVVELHISGLPESTEEKDVRQLCRDFDLQIVKVAVEMDPVRNFCKGRAKIMVRYNPMRDSIAGLVQRLQETRLRVEL